MADNSSLPPWWDDHAVVQRNLVKTARRFERSSVDPAMTSKRVLLGGQAIRLLKRIRTLRNALKRSGRLVDYSETAEKNDLYNLFTVTAMCAWHHDALKYGRELIGLRKCASDRECYCGQAGRIVSLLRQTKDEVSADDYFQQAVLQDPLRRCPYTNSWQMPTPTTSFAHWLEMRTFWEPSEFATGRLLRKHADELLRELRPFTSFGATGASTDGTAGPAEAAAPGRAGGMARLHGTYEPGAAWFGKSADAELVVSGWWRQLALLRQPEGWNATVCGALPTTCGLLEAFYATDEGARELGEKVKIFELGPGARLLPHYGPTNTRLLMHFLVSRPPAGRSTLRVGRVTHEWGEPGEMVIFDDSIEHEVSNEGEHAPRVVLAVQLKHPQLGEGYYGADGALLFRDPTVHGTRASVADERR